MIADLFVNPIELGWNSLWLVLPLSAGVSIVYKTVRARHVRNVPAQAAVLFLEIVAGLIVLALALHLLLEYVA